MEKHDMSKRAGDDQTIDLRSIRVLIIDDEPMVVKLLSRQLCAAGCRIWGAGSAEEGIALARCEDLDVIMLDLCLPGVSGYGAIDSLKHVSNAAILMMTGYADEEIKKDAMMLGADGLIGKPYELQQLVSMLRDLTSRRKEVDPVREVAAII